LRISGAKPDRRYDVAQMTQVIIALDVDRPEEAARIVEMTRDGVSMYKVGSILFTSYGPRAGELVKQAGGEVFLDLKFHDIPNTVKGAVRAAASAGVGMLTVHASGGIEMMQAALEGAEEGSGLGGGIRPKVIGVTILTSMVRAAGTLDRVLALADDAAQAGIDGIVCSPLEVGHVKKIHGDRLLAVVPGIRLKDQATDDQARVGTPGQAARDGADFLVVGRSVTASEDPVATLTRILKEAQDA
jgi:orotidine-5'-phosphate decarboxylase